MKDENISLLNYHFKYYFEACIQKYKIKILSHHFTSKKIEGLTVVDRSGISFSYEKTNPKVKQNFTLCHELGHFILKHEGNYFTESVVNQENILEREANIFSAVVLMPDIVLLSKIYYNCESFNRVHVSLETSKQSLAFRLLDLLREHFKKEKDIKLAIESYIDGQNAQILLLFHKIKEKIINEFNSFQPNLINKIKHIICEKHFISSNDLPELLNQNIWSLIKQYDSNLKTWLVYNKGNTIAYVWDSRKMSDKEAKKKAELQLLLMETR